jgi:hypothetical protein
MRGPEGVLKGPNYDADCKNHYFSTAVAGDDPTDVREPVDPKCAVKAANVYTIFGNGACVVNLSVSARCSVHCAVGVSEVAVMTGLYRHQVARAIF